MYHPISDNTAGVRVRLRPELQDRLNAEVDRIAAANGVTKDDVLRFARELLAKTGDAALAAHPTGPGEAEPVAWGVPADWKLVPVEPTQEMVRKAYRQQPDAINAGFSQAYRAMLEAAPTPPAGDAGAEPAGEDDRPLAEQAKHHGRDWAVWWQGSGERGDHIMELRQNGVGYARELAFLGADHHDQAGVLVAEHNEQMRRLREVIARQAAAKGLLQKEVARLTPAEPAVSPARGEDLEGLSARAAPGEWCGHLLFEMTEADSDFCDALVNAYRSGALLPAASRPAAGREEIEDFYSMLAFLDLKAPETLADEIMLPKLRALVSQAILIAADASRGEPEGGR